MQPPKNTVRSFLGVVNNCACFILYFATLAEPLRKLTRSDAEWAWGNAQQDAFHQLQVLLTSDCIVAHYNQAAETELKVHARPVGLSAILVQRSSDNVHPVTYASRTFTLFQNGGGKAKTGTSCMKVRLRKTLSFRNAMRDQRQNNGKVTHGPHLLTEDDIPGSSLSRRNPASLKPELRFWLKCQGNSCKGLTTKAQLVNG